MGIINFRKYARVEVDIPIRFFVAGSEATAYLDNISEEGASLISPFTIPIGTTMEFDIRLPEIEQPAHVRADVLWSRSVQEGEKILFAHGLLFNRIEIEDRMRLHTFVQNSMSY